MLKKARSENDVVTVKIATGEEIIGYFLREDDKAITLRKPVTLVVQDAGVALVPFIMTSDYLKTGEEVPFFKQSVVTVTSSAKNFVDAYTQQVSGVTTVSKPGLIMP